MDLILYFTFNFFIYGIVGWVLENGFSYFKSGHMQRDGFLHIPFKPMYAIAMSILVICSKVSTIDMYTLLTLCLIVPTFVEFITGLMMRGYFKKDYWNYSDLKGNYKGIICIGFSFIWMILSFIGVKYLQVYIIDNFYNTIQPYWSNLWYLFIITLVLDDIDTIRDFKINRKSMN